LWKRGLDPASSSGRLALTVFARLLLALFAALKLDVRGTAALVSDSQNLATDQPLAWTAKKMRKRGGLARASIIAEGDSRKLRVRPRDAVGDRSAAISRAATISGLPLTLLASQTPCAATLSWKYAGEVADLSTKGLDGPRLTALLGAGRK
jgi:hypothetical protein